MRFLEMAFAFAVIGFVVANAAISLLTVLIWHALRRSERSSDALFLLRMLPSAGSAILVLGVILPSFLSFEPRGTSERAGPALAIFVVVALALVIAGARRALKSWLETRRLERAWSAAAVRSTTLNFPVRAYRVPSDMPLAALVGVIRPRLFLSDAFLDGLLPDERQAVLDHEAAHLGKLDNLKRAAMKLAPDWLALSTSGGEIEGAWTIAAEEEADDRAAGIDRGRSLDLASALIKASRMAPVHCAPASNFCGDATIVRRVARLLDDRPARPKPLPRRLPRLALALALLGAGVVLAGPALRAVYTLTEGAVRLVDYGSW